MSCIITNILLLDKETDQIEKKKKPGLLASILEKCHLSYTELGAVPENTPHTGSHVDCPGEYGQRSHRRKVGQVLMMKWNVASLRLSKT